MTRPTPEDVIGLLEEAVFADPGQLHAGLGIGEVAGWDSNSAVYFSGEVAGRWGVALANDSLRACRTVADLVALVRRDVAP